MDIGKVKNFLKKRHHTLIIIAISVFLLTAIFLMNSENLGLNFEELKPSSQQNSQEKSLEEETFSNPRQPSQKNSNSPPSSKKDFQEVEAADYSNFISTLLENEMISAIPKGGSISLTTYNFNSGERVNEKTYILKKDSVYEGSESVDIHAFLSSHYVNQINSNNVCDILTKASNQGHFGAWSELETTSLMWKYKSMLKYRDCLGL